MRWAIPTCSPIAVYPSGLEPDLARDHLAGVEAYPQPELDTVTPLDL